MAMDFLTFILKEAVNNGDALIDYVGKNADGKDYYKLDLGNNRIFYGDEAQLRKNVADMIKEQEASKCI